VKYRTIVADPPWPLAETEYRSGGRRARSTSVPYRLMSIEQIAALDAARDAADDDAHLFLWATRKVFREGQAATVARAWGFEPCGEIVWGLRNPGFGKVLGNDHEPVLIARRGSPALIPAVRLVGVHFWRQTYATGRGGKVHSAKPEGFLDLVEQISEGPYLEMFSRRRRMGWDTWGNESANTSELEAGA
jgi:N6-adenosine-specific RNA methylase IME4